MSSSFSPSSIDDKLIRSLLIPDSTAGQILFVQEGVALKGSSSHDAQTYLGTVFVASTPDGTIYILWLPYSFVFYIDPALVSPATKQSLALDRSNIPEMTTTTTTATTNTNTTSEGKSFRHHLTSDGHIPVSVMRAEWLFAQCVAFESVNRIRCKATMRGKRVITLHRSGTSFDQQQQQQFPLTFHDGGVDRLLAVLGSFATVQSAPGGSHDDYTVQHQTRSIQAPVHVMSPLAAGERSNTGVDPVQQFRDQTYRNAGNDASSSTAKKVGQKVLSNLVGLVSRGGKFLAEAFLDDDDNDSNRHVPLFRGGGAGAGHPSSLSRTQLSQQQQQQGSAGDGSSDFDMMGAAEPIEEVKPHLKFPASLPPRGPPLTRVQWRDCFDTNLGGSLSTAKFTKVRNMVFEGGISDAEGPEVANQVRAEIWKYLLGVYPVGASAAARQAIDEENTALYESVLNQWMSIGSEQERHFTAFRERRTAVDKDVARTDRNHAAFSDDRSDKLVQMRRLLLTYSFFNFDIGYCQGMSDLIAVLLLLYNNESEVFAVFKMIMVKCAGNFFNGEKHTMALQLRAVEVLTHAFIPPLYSHLQKQGATNMCFCFRWLLVLFKREFAVEQVVRIWDVIFACPFSDRYEIIMTTAMLRAASDQIIDHSMQFDELLKYSNSLCAGLTSVDELLRASSEFYSFCVQQYEWSNGTSSTTSTSTAVPPVNSSSSSSSKHISDQESKMRKSHSENEADRETRPSIRDLVDAFDMK